MRRTERTRGRTVWSPHWPGGWRRSVRSPGSNGSSNAGSHERAEPLGRAVEEVARQERALAPSWQSSRPAPRLVALGGGSGLPILLRGLQAAVFPRDWMGLAPGGRGGLRWASTVSVRVLIVDEDHGVRGVLKRLLEREGRVGVVGEAGDGEEAVRLARELRPDVVLMDLRIPRLASLEVACQIKAAWPDTKVIILTVHREEAYGGTAGKFGADAVLPKRALIGLLLSMKPQAESRRRAGQCRPTIQGGRP